MRKLYFIISLLFLFVSAKAQKVTREVDDFSAISMGIAADVYLTQGPATKVVLEGDQDDIEEVITETKGSKLVIRYKNNRGWNFRTGKIDIYITTPNINEISLGGSGSLRSENEIKADDLELNVSGSGKIILDVSADQLSQKISGSGNIELRGEADRVELTISGSGSLRAEELKVDHYDIQISGSGKCRIYAGDSIEASISGSGSVYYAGNPDKIISNVSGSGKVRKL